VIQSKTTLTSKIPLPDNDWEEELSLSLPSSSKGKTPLGAKSAPLFHLNLKAAQKAKKQGQKELAKLNRLPGWNEWGKKVKRKLYGEDY